VRDRIFVLVADVEHRQRLIDADNTPAFDTFRQRPRHTTGAGGQIQNQLIALQSQRFDQLRRQAAAHIRQAALIELPRVRRIVEASFMLVFVFMTVCVGMIVAMRVSIIV
jgi:hypothetical protein